MKITNKHYAKVLLDIANQDKQKGKESIKKFFQTLVKNNHQTRIKNIVREFQVLWNKQNKVVQVKITAKQALDPDSLEQISALVKEKNNAEQVILEKQVIKEDMLGGFVAEYDDKVIDASLRTRVNNLKSILK